MAHPIALILPPEGAPPKLRLDGTFRRLNSSPGAKAIGDGALPPSSIPSLPRKSITTTAGSRSILRLLSSEQACRQTKRSLPQWIAAAVHIR